MLRNPGRKVGRAFARRRSLDRFLVAGVEKDALYGWESLGGSFLNASGRVASVNLSIYHLSSRSDWFGYRHLMLLQLSCPRRQMQLCNPFLSHCLRGARFLKPMCEPLLQQLTLQNSARGFFLFRLTFQVGLWLVKTYVQRVVPAGMYASQVWGAELQSSCITALKLSMPAVLNTNSKTLSHFVHANLKLQPKGDKRWTAQLSQAF
eukprot:1146484-Pelagomonas_calceolata.AAC.2